MGGRPCIGGRRIRVTDLLKMMAGGATEVDVLRDFPDLEVADIRAALSYAAQAVDHPVLIAD
jgi:uncharacterized protein (DUF433 family)